MESSLQWVQTLNSGLVFMESKIRWAADASVAILMFLTVADIIGRASNLPILGTMELTEHIMVFMVFCGLAFTQYSDSNIKVDAFARLLPSPVRYVFEVVGLFLGALLFALITWRSGIWALDAWAIREVAEGPLSFPAYPSKLALVVGSCLVSLRYLFDAVRRMTGKQ